MEKLDELAASLEATYRSDPRPEVQRFLGRMASERKFKRTSGTVGTGRALGRGRRACVLAPPDAPAVPFIVAQAVERERHDVQAW
jgi:hypothetical protein